MFVKQDQGTSGTFFPQFINKKGERKQKKEKKKKKKEKSYQLQDT